MDEIQQTETHLLNQMKSYTAWWRVNDCYDDVGHGWHFAAGFKAGYVAAAEGGADICIPSTPPRKYWGIHYQNCKGRDKVNAWFEGYAHGILVAAQDGAANYSMMPTMGLQNYGSHQDASHEVYMESDLKENMVPAPAPPNRLPPTPLYDSPETGHSMNGSSSERNSAPIKNQVPMPQPDPFEEPMRTEPGRTPLPGPVFENPEQPVLPLPEARYDSPRNQNRWARGNSESQIQPTQYQNARAAETWWDGQNRQSTELSRNPFVQQNPWE